MKIEAMVIKINSELKLKFEINEIEQNTNNISIEFFNENSKK